MRNAFHAAAHLAIWAGLYVTGAVVCLAQLAGMDAAVPFGTWARVTAFAFCTAMAVYLPDREKLFVAWLDPADANAHPLRFAFLAGNAAHVRAVVVSLLMVAGWLGMGLLAWGALVPVLAAAGVLVYAGRPRGRRPRPKDIGLLKNVYVAAGIASCATVGAAAAVHPEGGQRSLWEIAVAHAVPLSLSWRLACSPTRPSVIWTMRRRIVAMAPAHFRLIWGVRERGILR